MTNITAHIVKEVAVLKAAIKSSPYTLEESIAASDVISAIFKQDSTTDEDMQRFADLSPISTLLNNINQVKQYEETLAADLMKIETKYVVTNTTGLTSPAGFHPDEFVFIQTEIAIHTNSLKNIPSSNVQLYAHEMKGR